MLLGEAARPTPWGVEWSVLTSRWCVRLARDAAKDDYRFSSIVLGLSEAHRLGCAGQQSLPTGQQNLPIAQQNLRVKQ